MPFALSSLPRLLGTGLLLWFALMACAGASPTPRVLVEDLAARVFTAIEAERDHMEQEPERLHDLVKRILLPHVDFEQMARWALDRAWEDADSAQRVAFVHQFRRLLVRTYATVLLQTGLDRIEFLTPVEIRPGRVLVRSNVTFDGGLRVPVHYAFHRAEARWLAYDLSMDGVSLVANYRRTFRAFLVREGLDALIAQLADHNGVSGSSAGPVQRLASPLPVLR